MNTIPEPEVLDPDRVLGVGREHFEIDHEARADHLADALRKTCAYARQLWRQLDANRAYLHSALPPDPRSPSGGAATDAAPTAPDDTDSWNRWMAAYAETTSVLAGPAGDSGYGREEAQREADLRRHP